MHPVVYNEVVTENTCRGIMASQLHNVVNWSVMQVVVLLRKSVVVMVLLLMVPEIESCPCQQHADNFPW